MILPMTRLTPPPTGAEVLQPLREVGTMEKTQFWDIDDVMQALRVANRHGIPIKNLRREPSTRSAELEPAN